MVEKYAETIGIHFKSKKIEIDNIIYTIKLWDIRGQERFRNIIKVYYKESYCGI